MGDFSQNLAPRRSRRWPRWLSHRNGEAAACAVTTAKSSAPTVAHFAKPARIPPRDRAASPKTIPKTVRKTVKTSNNRLNFRMVNAYATPYATDVGAHQLGATLRITGRQRNGNRGCLPSLAHVWPKFGARLGKCPGSLV